MSARFGLLCFCGHWHNHLLWSHYADRHRGICLGFDVSDEWIKKVKYTKTRTSLKLPITEAVMQSLLFTKSAGWKYEQEWRCWFRLQDRDITSGGFYFCELNKDIQIREIIIGPICNITIKEITEVTNGYKNTIEITKARLAFKSFSIVKDKRGLAS